RKALSADVVRVLGKSKSKDATALLKEYAVDQTLTPDIRLQARLALAKSGEVLPPASESGGNLSAVETTFTLAWPADKSVAPKKKLSLPSGTIKPIASYSEPGGETWVVFVSARYGNPDDIWLARGSGGSWKEFLFTGRQFERRNRYYNGRMG